jgi:outer membrane protein assembly factor BamD (BamD/ComL family)
MNNNELGTDGSMFDRFFGEKKSPPPFTGPDPLTMDPQGWKRAADPEANPEAAAEFKAADSLFRQAKLEEAESAFKTAAKKRKDTPWGEKAQYFLAETQFQRARYVAANDSFVELFNTYPGTEFQDKAVRREYEIAQIWLASQDPKAKPEKREQWNDRFTGRLPLIGVSDWALKTLEHVRHHDAEGPLADEALMKIADFHYENQDWEEAAIYYDELVNSHRKSRFARQALLRSIDAKIKGYLGPDYDASGLEQARVQIKQALDAYPEIQDGTAEKLYKTLDQITAQEAEHAYKVGEHYLWTGYVTAAEYAFGEIPVKWPNSPFAPKAKEQLAKISKMPRKEILPSKIMGRPGAGDPYAGGISPSNPAGPMGAMGGMTPLGP